MQEMVEGFRIIKAFNLEDVMRGPASAKSIASVEAAANRNGPWRRTASRR